MKARNWNKQPTEKKKETKQTIKLQKQPILICLKQALKLHKVQPIKSQKEAYKIAKSKH